MQEKKYWWNLSSKQEVFLNVYELKKDITLNRRIGIKLMARQIPVRSPKQIRKQTIWLGFPEKTQALTTITFYFISTLGKHGIRDIRLVKIAMSCNLLITRKQNGNLLSAYPSSRSIYNHYFKLHKSFIFEMTWQRGDTVDEPR